MTPLPLEADNLGSKHRSYNKLLEKALSDGVKPEKINPDESDLDNLLKIDIACKQKNVAYILEVLKSEDMLYVSRVIKQSAWLITEKQYMHIVNPDYLHTQLFPQMTTKARNKLMLHIRLTLKDENRIDKFYKYNMKTEPKKAQRWLPKGSLDLIVEEIKKHTHNVDNHLFKRFSERGFAVFKQLLESMSQWEVESKMGRVMFLLKTDTESFLNVCENLDVYNMPKFGPKATEILMKKCPQRINDNFEKYAYKIHFRTFAKHLNKDEIKDFMLKHMRNVNLQKWCNSGNMNILLKHMPIEGKFEFVKQFFIERTFEDPLTGLPHQTTASVFTENGNHYRWYRYAPFDVAFAEIKQLIQLESSFQERSCMLSVVLFCAKRNPQHIHELLQYYHDKHMNEPFKFKIPFVNKILSQTKTHNYNDKTWTLLDSILYSMGVYSKTSDTNVQPYIEAIIAYNVLHGGNVPEIVANKFNFNSMKKLQSGLKVEEKTKIFNYLYNTQITKITSKVVTSDAHFKEILQLLDDVMSLLLDWQRDVSEFPEVLDKIRDLIKIKKENGLDISMSSLYAKNKKWRQTMFEESLALSISEESLINVIKHDPNLLLRNNAEVELIRYNDNVTLTRLLRKLRVYFPQTVTSEWTTDYVRKLNQTNGLKALTRGICILLPRKPLLEIIQKYAPTDTKINWTEDDEHLLSLCNYFGKYMHLARPLICPNVVLLYARGDYLQFVAPSLNAVSYNISPERSREMLSKLLEQRSVSLQKYGVTLAFHKLQPKEIKQMFANLWQKNNNATIRARLFKRLSELLCKVENDEEALQIWDLLSTFIDNLSSEEDRTIYRLMSNKNNSLHLVPVCVRGKFCQRSYEFLTSLPPKADCGSFVKNLRNGFDNVMEHLDFDFISDVVQKNLEDFTIKTCWDSLLPSYMLCVKNEEAQAQRYDRVLLPLLDRCIPLWEETDKNGYHVVRQNMTIVLQELQKGLFSFVLARKMTLPIKLFADIANKLEEKFPIEINYVLLRTWKLKATLVKLLDGHRETLDTIEVNAKCLEKYYSPGDNDQWNPLIMKVSKDFAQACINYLKEDLKECFPSIIFLFGEALLNVGSNIHCMAYLDILNNIIDNCDNCPKCYIMVLKSFPIFYCDKAKNIANKIRNKIGSHPSVEVKMHFNRVKSVLDF